MALITYYRSPRTRRSPYAFRKRSVSRRRSPRRSVSRRRSPSRGRSPRQLFVLRKGGLTQYGYGARLPIRTRQTALKKAVKAGGRDHVIRQVNAIRVLSRNRNPDLYAIYTKDLKFVERM